MEGVSISWPGSNLPHTTSVSSITSSDESIRILDEKTRGIRSGIGANQLDPIFFELLRSLEKMAQLPEDHSFHLAKDVQLRASLVLVFSIHHYEILPKLLPESSDCLSLTWEDNDFKHFLSLDSNDADLTLLDKTANSTFIKTLCEDGTLDYEVINQALKLVAGPLNRRSRYDAKR